MSEKIKIGEYEITLPPKPGRKQIPGWNSRPENQKWRRTELYRDEARDMDWEELRLEEELKQCPFLDIRGNPDYNGRYPNPGFVDYNYVNPEMEAFRKQEWDRRLNGYWFMNHGVATYITGEHYFYINWWKIDIGYPKYRDADRKSYILWWAAKKDPDCFGVLEIMRRRQGKSWRAAERAYEPASRTKNFHSAMQSKDGASAKEWFKEKVISPWKDLPDFFLPLSNSGSDPSGGIEFKADKKKGKKSKGFREEELNSWIKWGTATSTYFDGQKVHIYISDEYGKCLALDTPVRMFNGSVKKVQDIKEGELLMGNDSTPRTVLTLAKGQEMMYDIIPKNGEVWGCNESHILSLKWCKSGNRLFNKYRKGDVVNISVRNYLQLSKDSQRHLMLYKVGVEYPERQHSIPPYLLGAWLGDGTSNCPAITNIEPEIIEYLQEYCIKNTLKLRESVKKTGNTRTWHISTGQVGSKYNPLANYIKQAHLQNNKHIPKNYLIDSRKNRLELLAGLIDTDGYKNPRANTNHYEIVQKNQLLGQQIADLANGLGFKATLAIKNATMKREDGSRYNCPVADINIYGDNLNEIPCLVERKKTKIVDIKHKNSRNPKHTGFSVIQKGIGDYYGFTIDGNRLFLLGDYTVTHNTLEINVVDRHYIVKKACLEEDTIIGKMYYITTTEEMETGGGNNAKILWDDSAPIPGEKRNKSGMWRYFQPAYEGFLIDEYGNDLIEESKKKILKSLELLKNDPRKYNAEKRFMPFTIEDCWGKDGTKCHFNPEKLLYRIKYLEMLENIKKPLYAKFKLVWADGKKDSYVKAVPDPNGRFYITYHPGEFENNVSRDEYGRPVKPSNKTRFVIGCDSYDHEFIAEASGYTQSNGGAACFRKYDDMIDGHKREIREWVSNRFVMEYIARPTPDVFYEDMIMACVYWGCQLHFERTKIAVRTYFINRGYKSFLQKRPDETYSNNGHKDKMEGTPASTPMLNLLVDTIDNYISEDIYGDDTVNDGQEHGYTCLVDFPRMARDWFEFDITKTRKYDITIGSGYALVGTSRRAPRKKSTLNHAKYFVEYDNTGTVGQVRGSEYEGNEEYDPDYVDPYELTDEKLEEVKLDPYLRKEFGLDR